MTDKAENVTAAPEAPLTRKQALARERLTNTGSIEQITVESPVVGSPRIDAVTNPFDTQNILQQSAGSPHLEQTPVQHARVSESPTASESKTSPSGATALTRREMRAMWQAQEAVEVRNDSQPVADAQRFAVPVTRVTDVQAPPFRAERAPSAIEPELQPSVARTPGSETRQPQVAVSTVTSEFNILTGLASRESGWATATESDEKLTWLAPDSAAPVTSRDVAITTAGTATNALILSTLPKPDVTAPLNETGEILLTGSIDLPRGFGTLGAHPNRIDTADIDESFEAEIAATTSDLSPVQASRAISSQPVEQDLITPPKRRNTTLPLVLMIAAGVLAVGVSGLLVAYVFHIL